MKMRLKKIIALVLVCLLALPVCMSAFAESEDGYFCFIGFGGDKEASNDWGWNYAGADVDGITATNAYVKPGETVRIGLEFASPVFYTWWCAPCIVVDDSVSIVDNCADYEIKCFIDGEEIAIDMAADANGKTSWGEGTGDFTQCIRLAGGYNEWATQYIASPANFTKLEYEITFNGIKEVEVNTVESTAVYDLFIALGGDKAASNDWGWGYAGGFTEGVTDVKTTVKSGDTATVSLTFAEPVLYTWYCAPCLTGLGAGKDIAEIDADIVCKIDGAEVPVDLAAGPMFWSEGTGDYAQDDCVRLAGGYNEWAAQYIASPQNFTTIEYTITFNSIKVAEAAVAPTIDVDAALAADYNAYMSVQSETYIFRNSWFDQYGKDYSDDAMDDYFSHLTGWDENSVATNNGGVFTDAVINGDGTYTVSLNIAEGDAGFGTDSAYNFLYVTTDIPYALIDQGILTISDVKTSVDGLGGKEYSFLDKVADSEKNEYLCIMVQSTYNNEVKANAPALNMAASSIDITFTVSGFGREGTPAAPVDVEPAPADDKAVEFDWLTAGIIAGSVILVGAIVGICIGAAKKGKKKEETAAE